MKDQAEGLRLLARKMGTRLQSQIVTEEISTRIITVTSGKGGVGKSNLAVNLAIAIGQLEKKVILLDADLGLANIDVILGINPKYNLSHVIKDEKKLSDIIYEGPKGLKIIPGGSGMHELANLNELQLQNFLTKLSHLDGMADYLIIDTGAGLHNSVISFSVAADEILLVTTPEPTSLTDAYGAIKTILQHGYKGNIQVIVNRAKTSKEALTIFMKLYTAVERFLQYNIKYFGCIYEDRNVVKSVQEQMPYTLSYPDTTASKSVRSLAFALCQKENNNYTKNRVVDFFNRVSEYFR